MAQHWHQFNLTASSIPACRENWRHSFFRLRFCSIPPRCACHQNARHHPSSESPRTSAHYVM
jgi:hypothetical protein